MRSPVNADSISRIIYNPVFPYSAVELRKYGNSRACVDHAISVNQLQSFVSSASMERVRMWALVFRILEFGKLLGHNLDEFTAKMRWKEKGEKNGMRGSRIRKRGSVTRRRTEVYQTSGRPTWLVFSALFYTLVCRASRNGSRKNMRLNVISCAYCYLHLASLPCH